MTSFSSEFCDFFLNCGLLISLGLLCAERICVTCLGHLRKDYHFRIIFGTFPAGDSLSIHFTWVRLQTQVISTSFQETQHWEKQYIPLQKKETNTPVILYCKCSMSQICWWEREETSVGFSIFNWYQNLFFDFQVHETIKLWKLTQHTYKSSKPTPPRGLTL